MGAIANLFGYLLNFLYNTFNNYGIAIIVFSVILRIILIPVTIFQQKSMKKSAELQEKMKEILETIILNLVDDKDAVEIKEVENEKSIVFEVKVADEDFGKVIGKQGKIAQSIRTVMKAVAGKKDKKVNVEFIG